MSLRNTLSYIGIMICILCFPSFSLSQEQESTKQTTEAEEKYDMRTYYMVFLYKGANRTHDSLTTAKIQEGHLANIGRLHKEGKLCIAGPFTDDTDLRGIFILTVDSIEEAKLLCETDPAIKAGRLRYEIHPWMSARGSKLP